MYARSLGDRTLTLQVSGMLWNRSLVIRDVETGSLWSHLLGRCMDGELIDQSLESVPSVMTSWQAWRQARPETDCVVWPQTDPYDYDAQFYQRHGVENFVIGVASPTSARAFRFPDLKATPLVNDRFEDRPIVIWFDTESGAARCFERNVNARELTFHFAGDSVVDQQTGSHWNMNTGKATQGELAGTQLKPRVALPSEAKAWSTFHPNSSYWSPPEN